MLTVPEAANRLGKNPETIRRWIRAGRLPAHRVGTQHLVDERDLAHANGDATLDLPEGWMTTSTGEPMPDVVAAIRRSRAGH